MGKLPDRWLPYSSVGQPIQGTKFIAFKVPLKDGICRNLKPEERFTPSMLLDKCPRLSLVVDLTNTRRYYNPQEFQSKGVRYEKIFCPGKVVPHDDYVQKFVEIVDSHISEIENSEGSLIGVHCTHGLNRTAYFICNYMIKRLNIPAQEAISAFEQARGHPIERQEYIQALIDKVSSDTLPTEQSLKSPLGSLYENHSLTTKYTSRDKYQPRPVQNQYNNNKRDYQNPSSYNRYNRRWQRNPAQNGNEYHTFQQNRFGNNSKPNDFVKREILQPGCFTLPEGSSAGEQLQLTKSFPSHEGTCIGNRTENPGQFSVHEGHSRRDYSEYPRHLPLHKDQPTNNHLKYPSHFSAFKEPTTGERSQFPRHFPYHGRPSARDHYKYSRGFPAHRGPPAGGFSSHEVSSRSDCPEDRKKFMFKAERNAEQVFSSGNRAWFRKDNQDQVPNSESYSESFTKYRTQGSGDNQSDGNRVQKHDQRRHEPNYESCGPINDIKQR